MRAFGLLAILLILPLPLTAHEFWLEPERFVVAQDDTIAVNLKNGETFSGIKLAFFERNIARFEWVYGDKVQKVDGRSGDVPAMTLPAPGDGLVIIVHETQPSRITYKTWEKFAAFAEHKDFAGIEETHIARGLPQTGFRERYTRHAKALVAVGDGRGADRPFGLATEIVALENPYNLTDGDMLPVLVLAGGAPRLDAQVEIFERDAEGAVTVTTTRTDDAGQAVIPVRPGRDYLIDAVLIEPLTDSEDDAVWLTRWAALTFSVPAR